MSKRRLFLDADNTIINSTKAYCDVYSILYEDHSEYIKPDISKLQKWDLTDICPSYN